MNLRKVRSFFTWERVRIVGDLQLLTRASYVLIGLVPIMVGIWPSIRVVVNNHNQMLERSSERLEAVSSALNTQIGELRAGFLAVENLSTDAARNQFAERAIVDSSLAAKQLTDDIGTAVSSLRRNATLSPWLPQSLAVAFFAALAVVFGHFVYQWMAPAIIKKDSRDGYIKRKRDAFREHQGKVDIVEAANRYRRSWWRQFSSDHPDFVLAAWKAYDVKYEKIDEHHLPALFISIIQLKLKRHAVDRTPLSISSTKLQTAAQQVTTAEAKLDCEIKLKEDENDKKWLQLNLSLMISYDRYRLQESFEVEYHKSANMWKGELANITTSLPTSPDIESRLRSITLDLFRSPPLGELRDEELRVGLNAIGEAARLDYNDAMLERPGFIAIALGLYVMGGGLLAFITYQQCLAVAAAAGWIGVK